LLSLFVAAILDHAAWAPLKRSSFFASSLKSGIAIVGFEFDQ
jgi:hypothetical protein